MLKELKNYIEEPRNPVYNFELGNYYEGLKQYSAAIGLYLRTAEYGADKLLAYESFLRIALCFEIIGRRTHTLKGVLLKAVTIIPERPEAYFLLSRIYEVNKDWHEAYAWSVVGGRIDQSDIPLRTDVKYPGKYGCLYERAVVSWWIGLYYESLSIFKFLKDKNMPPIYQESINNNIRNVIGILQGKGKWDEKELKEWPG